MVYSKETGREGGRKKGKMEGRIEDRKLSREGESKVVEGGKWIGRKCPGTIFCPHTSSACSEN